MLSTVVTTFLASSALAASPEVIILPAGTSAYQVSDDGNVVVGVTATGGFRWTPSGGVEAIPGPAAGNGTLISVSGDGLQIAADVLDANNKMHAAFWQGGSDWNEISSTGFVSCDAFFLNSYDLNQDGTVLVGLGWITGCKAHAFRWDPVNGTVDLGSLVENRSSRANAVDGSGNIVVGWQDLATGQRVGARWINGVESYIPAYVAPGGTHYTVGEALGVSNSGTHIVGYNVFNAPAGPAWHFDTSTNTVSALQNLAQFGSQDALANGVTDDGTIIVGTSGGMPLGRKAIIWINGVGQDLKTYIESKGGSIAPYTSLGTAMAISPNGRTIVGWGVGAGTPPSWIVRFPAECPSDLNADGSVGADDLAVLLGAWGGRGAADLSGNGSVGAEDIAILLGAWGPCIN